VTAVSSIIILFFYFLPELAVKLLFSAKYLPISGYLAMFGFSMMLSALANVFANYFVAIHDKIFIYPFAVLTILQVIGFTFFHASITQIIYNLLITSALLFISMAIVYSKNKGYMGLMHEDPIIN
jgi:hypothetical protein